MRLQPDLLPFPHRQDAGSDTGDIAGGKCHVAPVRFRLRAWTGTDCPMRSGKPRRTAQCTWCHQGERLAVPDRRVMGCEMSPWQLRLAEMILNSKGPLRPVLRHRDGLAQAKTAEDTAPTIA